MFNFFRTSGVLLMVTCSSLPSVAEHRGQMRLNLPEGFQREVKIAVETKCITTLYLEEQVSHRRERAIGFLCRVKERCSDGSMRIEFKYNWLRDSTMSDAPGVYDSADPNAPRGWGYRKDALDALLERDFVAEVAPTGQVRRIEGFARLYDDLHRALAYQGDLPRNIKIGDETSYRTGIKEGHEKSFQAFFSYYWPLSEEALTETVQEFFVTWPRPTMEKGQSWRTEQTVPALALRRDNAWTIKEKKQERIVVELLSQVQTDLNLCNSSTPSTPNELSYGAWDFLSSACPRYQKWQYPTNYAGQRKGFFNVDPKSGLIRTAAWNEELSGTVQFPDPRKNTQELTTCPTERTCSVMIQITEKEASPRK